MEYVKNTFFSALIIAAVVGVFLLLRFLQRKTSDFADSKANIVRLTLYSLIDQMFNIYTIFFYAVSLVFLLLILHFYNILAWLLCGGIVVIFIIASIDSYKSFNKMLHKHKKSKAYIITEALVSLVLCVPIYFAAVVALTIRFPYAEWLIPLDSAVMLILLLSVVVNAIVGLNNYKKTLPHIHIIRPDESDNQQTVHLTTDNS